MLLTDNGCDLLWRDTLEDVESRRDAVRDTIENLLRTLGAHSTLERSPSDVQSAPIEPLAGEQVLLEFAQDLILRLHTHRSQIRDGVHRLLDVIVGKKLHDLPAHLMSECNEEDAKFLPGR